MAIINYSPWTDAANVGQGIGNNLAHVFLQLPALRAQMAYQAARLGIEKEKLPYDIANTQAQTGMYGAHEGYYKAAAEATTAKNARDEAEAAVPAQAGRAVASGLFGSPERRFYQNKGQPTAENAQISELFNAVQALTQVAGSNPQQGQQAVQQFLTTQQSGLQNNPKLAQMNLLGDKLFSNVPPSSTVANQLTGQPVMTAPARPFNAQNTWSGLSGMLNVANLIDPGGPLEQLLMQVAQQQGQGVLGTNAPNVKLPTWDPATRKIVMPGGK